ncbi:alpha/beta fold hydrolase [Amnibacterium kyonggiense]|uniref:Alpha/beta hydrolase family protein n=1 Tax=Amnibacterium kyonggiense TaxID=595671 RepID=A0A4R7FM90_9MICO|nr:alpha/beta fold hydrolase [Amnibacterium kyonggiense]TDS77575.1 alpha/beta hydrolase family protein [Amnibacterium kyonggiense]
MTDGTLQLDGAHLSWSVLEGDRPTVVQLHGLSSSRASEATAAFFDWSPVSAAGRRLVRYDARGHGRSTGRAVPDDYAWPALAEDLFALLDEVAPGEAVDAIGVSMGAGTLLHAVTQRPERFRRLVLVIPPTAWATRAAQGDAYRQMAALVEAQGYDALVRATAAFPPLPLLEEGGWTVAPPPDLDPAILPAVFEGAAATDLPATEAIAAIRQPVLLKPWVGDPGHPVSTSERLHELLPESTLEVMAAPEDVRALGERVAGFLA